MVPLKDFFNRPSFATPKERKQNPASRPASSSSPPEPPSSSTVDLTSEDTEKICDKPDTTEDQAPSPKPLQKNPESFLSASEAPSSLNESFSGSQRIIKGGKEVVISSDGEETESDDYMEEEPVAQHAHLSKPRKPPVVSASKKPISIAPPKYKCSIDSLVSQAVEDKKAEAKVAELKAKFHKAPSTRDGRQGSDKKNVLHEKMLTSALGDDDEYDGRGVQRVIEAVRRTEALDQDKCWYFLDQTRPVAAVPEVPKDLFHPSSYLGVLREPESRERALNSGMLEFALSRGHLSDQFVLWLFRSVPLEPRDELRQVYQRLIMHTNSARLEALVQPSDIDDLFLQLGAKPQALDFSNPIAEDTPDPTYKEFSLKSRTALLSIFGLLRDIAGLITIDALERALHIMLRITLDTSLMADDLLRSELQSCLTALLESVPRDGVEKVEHNICTVVYDTIRDLQFQGRMIQHILPTSEWISLLRCRLAMAFLLRSRDPFAESAQDVLDLKRLTVLLIRDERFQVKSFRGHSDRNFGDLIVMSILLDVVINSSLIDLQGRQRDTEASFNGTIDKVCVLIKKIFSSIEDAGASHLKRMLAKQALEAVHYRVVYSVRTKPPPMKTTFENETKQRDGSIKNFFSTNPFQATQAAGDETPAGDNTTMPLRPQRSS